MIKREIIYLDGLLDCSEEVLMTIRERVFIALDAVDGFKCLSVGLSINPKGDKDGKNKKK